MCFKQQLINKQKNIFLFGDKFVSSSKYDLKELCESNLVYETYVGL